MSSLCCLDIQTQGCRQVDYTQAQTLGNVIRGANLMLSVSHDMVEVFNAIKPQHILKYCDSRQGLIIHFDRLGGTMHNVTHQLHDSLQETLDILSCRSVS